VTAVKIIVIANQKNNMKKLRASVARACSHDGVDRETVMHVITAVEETYTNISRHAYKGKPGRIEISVTATTRRILVSLKDWGEPFEPAKVRKRTLDELIEKKIEGGLGMMMIERLVDKVRFRHADDHNETILVKNRAKSGKNGKGGKE
jgi:serine/threonine-protein kinase RsbW